MSHFTVLVIGDDHKALLAPYHEFECTGYNDEYVQDIDITEDAKDNYERSTVTRLKMPDGTLESFFDENGEWRPEYSQPNDFGNRSRFVPEGCEEVEIPTPEVENFSTWAEGYFGYKTVLDGESPDTEGTHKFGYVLLDADGNLTKVVKRTNPNAKWDWWQVGGRWSGLLKLKEGGSGAHGQRSWTNENEADDMDYCDQAMIGDIDLEGMRAEARKKADEEYAKASSVIAGRTWTTWETTDGSQDFRRTAYWEQPVVRALHEMLDHFPSADKIDSFLCTREEFVQRANDHAISTYAVILDGKWVARGEMGWWGMSNDEVSMQEWDRRFNEMLDQLPADTLVTLVDCHI